MFDQTMSGDCRHGKENGQFEAITKKGNENRKDFLNVGEHRASKETKHKQAHKLAQT